MGVPTDRAEEVHSLILENAEYVGFLREINGRKYVELAGASTDKSAQGTSEVDSPDGQKPAAVAEEARRTREQDGNTIAPTLTQLGQGIFIAHGKNKTPLGNL